MHIINERITNTDGCVYMVFFLVSFSFLLVVAAFPSSFFSFFSKLKLAWHVCEDCVVGLNNARWEGGKPTTDASSSSSFLLFFFMDHWPFWFWVWVESACA